MWIPRQVFFWYVYSCCVVSSSTSFFLHVFTSFTSSLLFCIYVLNMNRLCRACEIHIYIHIHTGPLVCIHIHIYIYTYDILCIWIYPTLVRRFAFYFSRSSEKDQTFVGLFDNMFTQLLGKNELNIFQNSSFASLPTPVFDQ